MTCSRYTESDSGRLKVVTSTTRPTGGSRYIGQHIYETDTDRQLYFDGTGWIIMYEPAQGWTPTFTGITGGTPTTTGYFQRSNGHIDIWARLTFGGAPSAISSLGVTLPYQAYSMGNNQLQVAFGDTGSQVYPGTHDSSTTGPILYAIDASAATANLVVVSASVPFSFGATDTVHVTGRYMLANRYV